MYESTGPNRRNLLKGALAGAVTAPAAGLWAARPASAAPAPFDVLIGDVNSGKIYLFDRNKPFTDANVKWSLDPAGGGHPMEHRFRQTSGEGELLLVATGSQTKGTASIYRRGDKKLLWSVPVGNYPHCVERARGTGVVVVAGRSEGAADTGGSLHVYRPDNQYSNSLKYVGQVPFHQAHGLLWDPGLELMWAIGGPWLKAYRIVTTASTAKLVEVTERRLNLKDDAGKHNGHDVQPDYRDPNRITITDSNGVYAVDKTTMAKTRLHDRGLVKSYVIHASGEQMWTGAEAGGSAFGTKYVHFNLGTTRPREGGLIYKARIDTTLYQ